MPPILDIAAKVVSMVPAPYLQPAIETFRTILSRVEQIQINRRQMRTMADAIAQILFTLNSHPSKLSDDDKWMLEHCHEFEDLLLRIANFCARNRGKKAFNSFLDASEVQVEINLLQSQLSLSIDAFQISSQISVQNYQKQVEAARREDQAEINATLKELHEKQDKILSLVGKPSAESSSLEVQGGEHDNSKGSHKTVMGLLDQIQETVNNSIDTKHNSGVLQEVLAELRKAPSPLQVPSEDTNPIVANLKPGLKPDVLIGALQWKMHSYMYNDLLTQHLYRDQITKFAKGRDGATQFVEYLLSTDDISLQYAALEVFRKDKTLKHFFKASRN